MPAKKRKRRAPNLPGFSINEFAVEVGSTGPTIRSAVKNNLIEVIDWNGHRKIPPREKDRYLETWGRPAIAAE